MSKQLKFKTKAGLCTPYALACGYQDTYRFTYEARCTHEKEHGVYHVKLHGKQCSNVINGTVHHADSELQYYWASFETLKESRKAYAKAKREVNRLIPK